MVTTQRGDAALSYTEINHFAAEAGSVDNPGEGLNTRQISHVLSKYGLKHVSIDYGSSPGLKASLPFEQFVYSGVESGSGALMVFDMDGPEAPNVSHIIACFGHTFNEDAWA
ncbi:hypothetical protein RZS08_35630, partial [Arthrospira platensis SPKY1]|nr:hypothetical protein [Arthrospira platensis SPKY1]